MKCIACGKNFEPNKDPKLDIDDFCDKCEETRNEMTGGKEED